MIALVLAAGFGTRLRPYSAHTPKPLFTLNQRPLLDLIIQRLLAAGARKIIVNTHHKPRLIEDFLRAQPYASVIETRHEPEILGTGGAIRNAADSWRPQPLLVVNSDIYTDMDFRAFYAFHKQHARPVSLVLCHHPAFNSVLVDAAQRVVGFRKSPDAPDIPDTRWLTFTGIQVVSEDVLTYIASQGFADSIDAYQAMIDDGRHIQAYIPENMRWSDLGTPERYRAMAREVMAETLLGRTRPRRRSSGIDWQSLPGDGSDRHWYRVAASEQTMIVADHGIKPSPATCEAEAFVAIGRHLHRKGLPVPEIFQYDTFAGLVFMEDLGSQNLQAYIQTAPDPSVVEKVYRQVLDILLAMSFRGAEQFDPGWTYQTPRYDHDVVLEKECRYFAEAFMERFLGVRQPLEQLQEEYDRIAAKIDGIQPVGFMHRDFQSRNIMVRDGRFYLIDFQGGRLGPCHYDLASLLIDPYIDLPVALRETLLDYFTARLAALGGIPAAEIKPAYRYCALSRNLQILGAYGFLTRQKGKTVFAQYIPAAVRSLQTNLSHLPADKFPKLNRIAFETIPRHLQPSR
jgi:aminoglycoside/choline kinase family phosphotransferase/GTP:adenosylcobinamide-phosphate guanylyltransferase